jgi:hypothetical protein
MSMFINTEADLKKFFDSPEKPMTLLEFLFFWKSLTPYEKLYYRKAPLH